MSTERRKLLIFSLGLVASLWVFYLPWLSGDKSFYLSDLTYYFEPFCRFIGTALTESRLPLWNPYSYCGMPQIAIPSPAVFYPPTWLFSSQGFSQALSQYLIFHQAVSGIGAYLLISSLGWGSIAAAACGCTLAYGGYMFSLQKNFTLLASAAWLPITIWAIRKTGQSKSAEQNLRLIASSLALYMMLAAGRPEITLPALALIVIYIAASAYYTYKIKDQKELAIRKVLWRSYALALALLLAMPIILPGLEWASLSPRAHGLAANEALVWSANWYDWLLLILAQPLGDLNSITSKFLPLVATRPGYIPFLSSAFIGPVAFTLAIWGAFDSSWRVRWIIIFIMTGSILATLGNYTIIFPYLLKAWPMLGIFRYPVKLIIVPVWCLALFTARGAYYVLYKRSSRTAQLASWIFWAFVLISSCALAATPLASWMAIQFKLLKHSNLDLRLIAEGLILIGQAGLRAALLGLTLCFLLILYNRNKLSRLRFAGILLAAIAASQLSYAFRYCRHAAEPTFFHERSALSRTIKRLAESDHLNQPYRILPLYYDPLCRPAKYQGQSSEVINSNFYQYGRQLLLPNTNMDFGLSSSYGYEAAETADYHQIFSSAMMSHNSYNSSTNKTSSNLPNKDLPLAHFCQLTATRYILTQCYSTSPQAENLPFLDKDFFRLAVENLALNFRIYRLRKPAPRAYFSQHWQWCNTHTEALHLVEQVGQSEFVPESNVILEHKSAYSAEYDPKPNSYEVINSTVAGNTEDSYVKFMQDEPEHVSLSIKSNTFCFVVLADHFYPGWHAKIDGFPTRLYRANAVERAVFTKPGSHLIEYDYDPDSYYDGQKFAITSLGILTILLAAAVYIMLADSIRGEPEE